MNSAKMAKMTKRVIFGAIMIGVLAALLWWDWRLQEQQTNHNLNVVQQTTADLMHIWGIDRADPLIGLPCAGIVALLSVVAFLEISRIAVASGARILLVSGLLATVALSTCVYWLRPLPLLSVGFYALRAVIVGPLVLSFVFAEQMIRRRTQDAFRDLAATVLAVAYIGGCGAAILHLRFEHGVPALVLFLAAAKFTDIGAYFTGSFLGKHKLIPWLSPGKSWEGLAGGLVLAAGVSALIVWLGRLSGVHATMYIYPWEEAPSETAKWFSWFYIPHIRPWQAAIFGAVVGLVGQFADLCESLLKRSAGVKDSGALVPEFGGVLDIIDSLLLSAPVAAILMAIMT